MALCLWNTTGRKYIKGLADGVTRRKRGECTASSQIIENARSYGALLTMHIDKEDNILYPMGESRLSVRRDQELLEEFERVERDRIGPGEHEELHKLLHHLANTYLQ